MSCDDFYILGQFRVDQHEFGPLADPEQLPLRLVGRLLFGEVLAVVAGL